MGRDMMRHDERMAPPPSAPARNPRAPSHAIQHTRACRPHDDDDDEHEDDGDDPFEAEEVPPSPVLREQLATLLRCDPALMLQLARLHLPLDAKSGKPSSGFVRMLKLKPDKGVRGVACPVLLTSADGDGPAQQPAAALMPPPPGAKGGKGVKAKKVDPAAAEERRREWQRLHPEGSGVSWTVVGVADPVMAAAAAAAAAAGAEGDGDGGGGGGGGGGEGMVLQAPGAPKHLHDLQEMITFNCECAPLNLWDLCVEVASLRACIANSRVSQSLGARVRGRWPGCVSPARRPSRPLCVQTCSPRPPAQRQPGAVFLTPSACLALPPCLSTLPCADLFPPASGPESIRRLVQDLMPSPNYINHPLTKQPYSPKARPSPPTSHAFPLHSQHPRAIPSPKRAPFPSLLP